MFLKFVTLVDNLVEKYFLKLYFSLYFIVFVFSDFYLEAKRAGSFGIETFYNKASFKIVSLYST